MFAIMVTSEELDILKLDAESLANAEAGGDAAKIGERMVKAVSRTARKLGYKYAH